MGYPCYPAASGLTPACVAGTLSTCTLVNYLNRTRMDGVTAYLEKYKTLVRTVRGWSCCCSWSSWKHIRRTHDSNIFK